MHNSLSFGCIANTYWNDNQRLETAELKQTNKAAFVYMLTTVFNLYSLSHCAVSPPEMQPMDLSFGYPHKQYWVVV